MQKELRQVQVLEDLDFNANVKHKTKEYVKKYMSKVGSVYRIKDDTWKFIFLLILCSEWFDAIPTARVVSFLWGSSKYLGDAHLSVCAAADQVLFSTGALSAMMHTKPLST